MVFLNKYKIGQTYDLIGNPLKSETPQECKYQTQVIQASKYKCMFSMEIILNKIGIHA